MAEIINIVSEKIRQHLYPIHFESRDYDPLLEWIGSAHYVLIGESTHGTEEFYRERAVITRRLIEEKGFSGVAVEADWPDAWRVNKFVKGNSADTSATEALADFRRFPPWLWRNAETAQFIDWLHTFNAKQPVDHKVGFYGMDLYSLYASTQAVIDYLDRVDPEAAQRARFRYGRFEQYGEDPQAYGYAASFGLTQKHEDDVVKQLIEMRERTLESLHRDGRTAEDAYFYSEQNARLVRNAEPYYRAMFKGREDSWNLRDRHMAETIELLMEFLERRVPEPRLVVWAHNSHLGDARATETGRRGELNVGQLVRERHGRDAWLLGCTTYTGTVTAAREWGGAAERRRVQPGLPGSTEELLHEIGNPAFMLNLREEIQPRDALSAPRLERAIGIIYRPESERLSHYFHARAAEQFDALLHLDQTRALPPLDSVPEWGTGEVSETYPFAI